MAWFALAPLFIAASRVKPRRALVLGVWWGVVFTAGVGWCLPWMLAGYFRLSPAASWAGSLGVAIGLSGIYSGCFTAWLGWLASRGRASPLLIAAGWTVTEFARAHFLIANPWAISGYSQVPFNRIIQIADASGPYGIGFLLAAINGVVAGCLVSEVRGRHWVGSAVAVVLAVSAALAYGAWRQGETFAAGPEVRVAVIQGGIENPSASPEAARKSALGRYVALSERALDAQPQVLFWPEYAVDLYLQEPSTDRDTLLEVTHRSKADLVLGAPHYELGETRVEYHNSIFVVRYGRVVERYDKVELIPFAESDELDWLRGRHAPLYRSGSGPRVLRTQGLDLGAFLCSEAMFPEYVRRFALQGATVLANLANDEWFRFAAPARLQLNTTVLRAVENRRYLVRVSSSGFSAIIDPLGAIVQMSEFGSDEVLPGVIRASSASTPYQRWGDAFVYLTVIVVIGASALALMSRPPDRQIQPASESE